VTLEQDELREQYVGSCLINVEIVRFVTTPKLLEDQYTKTELQKDLSESVLIVETEIPLLELL
jgi:hypothetical protein